MADVGLEAEVQECRRQLLLRDRYLAWVVHELRAPLTALLGVSQLETKLLQEVQQQAAASALGVQLLRMRSYFDYAEQQLLRMNRQVQDLTDLSLIQAGKFRVTPVWTNLAQVLRESVDRSLLSMAEESGSVIILEVPEEAWGRVDPFRFRGVVINLIQHVIRHSSAGGVIQLSLLLASDQSSWTLRLEDQSPQLSAFDRKRAFEPVEWVSIQEGKGGLGLALFLARQMLEAHGGRLDYADGPTLSTRSEAKSKSRGNALVAVFPCGQPDTAAGSQNLSERAS